MFFLYSATNTRARWKAYAGSIRPAAHMFNTPDLAIYRPWRGVSAALLDQHLTVLYELLLID